jgi:hypothetical protein
MVILYAVGGVRSIVWRWMERVKGRSLRIWKRESKMQSKI